MDNLENQDNPLESSESEISDSLELPQPKLKLKPASPYKHIAGVLIVILLVALGAIWYRFYFIADDSQIDIIEGSAYSYNPKAYLSDWGIITDYKTLAEIPLEIKKNFIASSVSDAALWEFRKGNETLLVISRLYSDKEGLDEDLESFKHTLAWKTRTNIFNNSGVVGISLVELANRPLMLYTVEDNLLIYAVYYNYKNMAYNNSNQFDDERYLIDMAKTMLNSN